MGAPRETVIGMIPTVLLPFNFAKGLMNSAIAMLLYRPIILSLRRAKLIAGRDEENENSADKSIKSGFNRFTLYTLIFGILTLAAAIVIFVILKK